MSLATPNSKDLGKSSLAMCPEEESEVSVADADNYQRRGGVSVGHRIIEYWRWKNLKDHPIDLS